MDERPVCEICGAPKKEMRTMLGKVYYVCIDCYAKGYIKR